MKRRIALIYRSPLLCDALAHRFASDADDFEVVARGSSNGRIGFRLTKGSAEVAVIDTQIAWADLLAICQQLSDDHPPLRILAVGEITTDQAVALTEAGVVGFADPSEGFGKLLQAITALAEGRSSCSVELARAVARRIDQLRSACDTQPVVDHELTVREIEVLELVAIGLANKQIACKLEIRVATVKNHVHRILNKLDVRNRRQASRLASRRGWLRLVPDAR